MSVFPHRSLTTLLPSLKKGGNSQNNYSQFSMLFTKCLSSLQNKPFNFILEFQLSAPHAKKKLNQLYLHLIEVSCYNDYHWLKNWLNNQYLLRSYYLIFDNKEFIFYTITSPSVLLYTVITNVKVSDNILWWLHNISWRHIPNSDL